MEESFDKFQAGLVTFQSQLDGLVCGVKAEREELNKEREQLSKEKAAFLEESSRVEQVKQR